MEVAVEHSREVWARPNLLPYSQQFLLNTALDIGQWPVLGVKHVLLKQETWPRCRRYH